VNSASQSQIGFFGIWLCDALNPTLSDRLLGGFFKHDTIYIVNLAEGLNLRAQPDMYNDANIMIVVPNSTPVTKLQDPVVRDNIPWLRVSVEVGGKHYEGWMSLKYLRQEQ